MRRGLGSRLCAIVDICTSEFITGHDAGLQWLQTNKTKTDQSKDGACRTMLTGPGSQAICISVDSGFLSRLWTDEIMQSYEIGGVGVGGTA